jgi:hypothetical protein
MIKNTATGQWIPQSTKARTHVELTNISPPRLFRRRCDATQALDWWLQGKWYMAKFGGWSEPSDYELTNSRVPFRKKEEMTIVKVIITEE